MCFGHASARRPVKISACDAKVLSILTCPLAMVNVFLEKKNSKNFKGGGSYACA